MRPLSIESVTVQPHSLGIGELTHTKVRQLTPEAALLHPAKRHAWVRSAIAVDEHAAGIQRRGHALGQRVVGGVDGRGQAEFAVVGQLHRMLRIPCADDRRHRPEQLCLNAVMSGVTLANTVGA